MLHARNFLLNLLSPEDLAFISAAGARTVEVDEGGTIENVGRDTKHVVFVESGIGSILLKVSSIDCDIGMIGREGMLGLPAALGAKVASYSIVARLPMKILCVDVDQFRSLVGTSTNVRMLLLRYVQAQIAQLAFTAVAARWNAQRRLARWLLMAHDRTDGDAIVITHDILGDALDATRSGVSSAVHELEAASAIRAERRTMTILSRAALKDAAGGLYGPAETAYHRLIGVQLSRS